MASYEQMLLVKNEVFVFKLPARTTIKGYRAADWNLNEPEWTGRMRMIAQGQKCVIHLEDPNTAALYAKCPIESYPGVAVEPVSDSSRFFVLRIMDDNGRIAFVGFGFSDRADSFDFNVALQDHFKLLKKTEDLVKEQQEPREELDLRFKEGETIKINMKITKKEGAGIESNTKRKAAAFPAGVSTGEFIKILPPPAVSAKNSPSHQPSSFGLASSVSPVMSTDPQFHQVPAASTATSSPGSAVSSAPTNPDWVQF